MTRRDVILRLHNTLAARKAGLGRSLARQLATLRDSQGADSPDDSADAAFDADSHEVSSQLAELDARELCQVEQALVRWEQGRYGTCDGGSSNCQREMEKHKGE